MGDFCLYFLPTKNYFMATAYVFHRFIKLQNDLVEIQREVVEVDELTIRALRIIKKFYVDFREYFRLNGFETRAEELFFFKIIKPDLTSRRIYYMEVFNWWKGRPEERDGVAHKVYWTDKILMLHAYCDKYRHVLVDWESDLQKLQAGLFAPESNGMFAARGGSGVETDAVYAGAPQFTYGHDDIAARVMAYHRLSRYCLKQLTLSEVIGARGSSQAAM
ncbi:RteC domain-containing protein [Puia sp. P3]|uniref:RteC domain-containing protein n=1 Tax=Puia sp. P3 TaxID=3423952 RepID=UPI003D67EC5D